MKLRIILLMVLAATATLYAANTKEKTTKTQTRQSAQVRPVDRTIDPAQAMAPIGKRNARMEELVLVEDLQFLRRVWLDLAGVIPTRADTTRFMNDSRTDKRAREIDRLLASEAFNQRLTTFFDDMFMNHTILEGQATWRNALHDQLYTMIRSNTPWDEMARRLIAGSGRTETQETAAFIWAREAVQENWRHDYLDDTTAWISENLLGIQTLCISCHDGQYHLEEVNVGLATMRRTQFWEMSAFLSSTYFQETYNDEDEEAFLVVEIDDPNFSMTNSVLFGTFGDEEDIGRNIHDSLPSADYDATTLPGQGMRPPRNGGIVAPKYPFTGETPLPGETRRQALARIMTADKQFARNMVNRLWAHLFGEGFVEPLAGWDLGRIDAKTAAANNSTVQARNESLMNWLTEWFIANNYDMRGLLRLMANSKLYQWDYAANQSGDGALGPTDPWGFWRENTRVRRIEAEAVVDSIYRLLEMQPKWVVTGKTTQVMTSAWQLPAPNEPSFEALIDLEEETDELAVDIRALGFESEEELFLYMESANEMLRTYGRGEYQFGSKARSNETTIQNALIQMNSFAGNWWMDYWEGIPFLRDTVEALDQDRISTRDLIAQMHRDFLFQEADAATLDMMVNHFANMESFQVVLETVWTLFNHPDFIYK